MAKCIYASKVYTLHEYVYWLHYKPIDLLCSKLNNNSYSYSYRYEKIPLYVTVGCHMPAVWNDRLCAMCGWHFSTQRLFVLCLPE